MKTIFKIFTFAMLMFFGISAFAQTEADKIIGTYRVESPFTDDVAKVKITKAKNGTYSGRITWVNNTTNADGSPRTDEKNPDPKLRSRKPEEIIMVWNLQFKDGEWVNGTLYDPYSGKKFSVQFKADGNNLKARYYKGVPAMGINAVWKRVN